MVHAGFIFYRQPPPSYLPAPAPFPGVARTLPAERADRCRRTRRLKMNGVGVGRGGGVVLTTTTAPVTTASPTHDLQRRQLRYNLQQLVVFSCITTHYLLCRG